MARKSRKQTPIAEPVVEAAPQQIFPTAIYARLSVENSGKSEKVDVIANQIEICKSYIADCPYLELIDTYIDNGKTGTVFDRPEFNRLMTDINSGKIKCLVVRDLSRFGRDYIETGTYLERVFPQIGLRFISIKEHYDNFDTDGSNESLIIPLQNIRLSLADEDTGYGNKAESDSIGNQRMLIKRFLDNHPVLSKCPRFEFADDGYTGTNFQRPQFTQMMEKVKRGEINLICVKDFSRFSRDYIETGNYLECTFPFMGVRFISINDGYDSDDYKGTTGGLEVVMRSIIYAAYSKDLSVKTTTAKIQMMKQGKYVGGYAPYGYVLHPTIRNKLAVDPEAATVIRRIFDEALAGRNTSQIARALNDDGVPTPGQYFKQKHPDKKKFSKMSDKISWEAVMVYKVIRNEVYTGTLISHKMKSCGVGSRKQKVCDPIIVEGTHEAIVTKEEFTLAQNCIRGGEKNPSRKQNDYPLKGLLRCGNCKRVMSRRKLRSGAYHYQCTHSTHDQSTECPVGESFYEKELEAVVFNALNQYLALAQKDAVQNREVGDLRKSAIKECADNIRSLQRQVEQLKAAKLRLYEKYTADGITREEYIRQKKEVDAKIAECEEAIRRGHERMQELDSEQSCSDEKLDAVCDEYKSSTALTYELTHAFISAIYVHDHNNIEIVWKFKDFLKTIG